MLMQSGRSDRLVRLRRRKCIGVAGDPSPRGNGATFIDLSRTRGHGVIDGCIDRVHDAPIGEFGQELVDWIVEAHHALFEEDQRCDRGDR